MSDLTAETPILPFADPGDLPTLESDTAGAEAATAESGAVALDIDGDCVTSFRVTDGVARLRRQASVYAIVDGTRHHRSLLTAAGVPFAEAGEQLLVLGDAAMTVAGSFDAPVVPAFVRGRLPDSDPVGRQVVALLVESVLPAGDGVCGISVPAAAESDSALESLIGNVVQLRGYRPLLVGGATAAGMSLLEDAGLSGLTVRFGDAGTELSMLLRGRESDRHVVAAGAEALVDRIAESGRRSFFDREGHRYRDTAAARQWLFGPRRDIAEPSSADEARLAVDVAAIVGEAAKTAGRMLATCGVSARNLPVVAVGGLTQIGGFDSVLGEAVTRSGIDPAAVRVGDDGLSVCRGLLALADAETPRLSAAA